MTEEDPDASRHDADDHFDSPREETRNYGGIHRSHERQLRWCSSASSLWGRHDEEAEK